MPTRAFVFSLAILAGTAAAQCPGLLPPATPPVDAPPVSQPAPSVPSPGGPAPVPGDTTPTPGGPATGGPSGPGSPVVTGETRGPSTPASGGPASAPARGGPSTGGVRAPATAGAVGPSGAGPSTGGGMPIVEDYGRWEFWWEFNKDRFLRIREAVREPGVVTDSDDFYMGPGMIAADATLAPSAAQVEHLIRPALLRTLESNRDREIVVACLVALAKTHDPRGKYDIVDLTVPHLSRPNRDVRAAAALALGISGDRRASFPLISLLEDTAAGRALVQRSYVDDWTRTFAAYGLGCLARASGDHDLKVRAFESLRHRLRDMAPGKREVRIGAIHAIGALRPDPRSSKGKHLAERCVRELALHFRADLGESEKVAQAHVPSAVAKLIADGQDNAVAAWFQDLLLRELEARPGRGYHLERSAALALGQLATPFETRDSDDRDVSDALWREFKRGRDEQTGHFALISLGQIGGMQNRDRLLEVLSRGSKSIDRPWAALALGLLVRAQPEVQEAVVSDALRQIIRRQKQPDLVASAAIALGLARCEEAVPDLRDALERFEKRDLVAGCTCLALGMLQDRDSSRAIRELLDDATHRPDVIRRASVALGLLGQKTAGPHLVALLRDKSSLQSIGSVSAALALIGDSSTVEPLIAIVDDRREHDFGRSMAAAALGSIADPDLLPWNEAFTADLNYRAAVETFANGGTGVFEIL